MRTYAKFATAPIGPSLAARDGGLTLTTVEDATSIDRMALSNVGHTDGIHGAEFVFWGDAPIVAAIGVAPAGAPLARMVGCAGAGIGLRLADGSVFVDGEEVASVPAADKGVIVGVRVVLNGAASNVRFYKGSTQIHSRAFDAGSDAWHFAASLGAAEAATLVGAVNAGQWRGAGPAVLDGGWQPVQPQIDTVRLSDIDWLSAPADAPANARWEGLIDAAGISTAAALGFWPWGGDDPQQGSAASLVVNDAGALDALLATDAAGVPVVVRQLAAGAALASATPVARFVLDRIEVQDDGRKAVRLRDAHDDLDELINPSVFLPSIPELAWRQQPAVIGAVANVPALRANSDGSLAWLSDAPLASVDQVMDRGDPMEASTWALSEDSQQIELVQPAVGPMTVDASSIGVDMAPASLERFLDEVFGRIDKRAWSSADAAAIDTATGYAGIGYYAGGAVTAREALAAVLPSYGAWWWQDGDGVLRFSRVVDPAGVTEVDLAFDLDALSLAADLVATVDEAPNLSRRMAYRPNAVVLSASDLVTDLVDVPPRRRDELTSPYRGLAYSGRGLPPRYAHADTNAPMISCFWSSADAAAEIDRVCALYGMVRSFYLWRISGDQDFAPRPGQVGRITYPRYGLAAGKQVLVRGVTRNPVTGDISMTLWG